MNRLLALWRWLVAIPRTLQLAVLAAVLCAVAVTQVRRSWHNYTTGLDNAGYVRAQTEAATAIDGYALYVRSLQSALDSAQGLTDTVRVVVTRRVTAVSDAIAAVPAAVRDSVPTVAAALDACDSLVVDVTRLTAAVQTERLAAGEVHAADSVMIVAQSVSAVAYRDTIAQVMTERDRKPGWRMVTKAAAVMLVAGVGVGRWVLR